MTWNNVADFQGGVSSTFQLILYASGLIEVTIDHMDPAARYGVTGIAPGQGQGLIQAVDLSTSTQTLQAGAILEAFAAFTDVDRAQVAREFYKTHPDKFDYLIMMSDFSAEFIIKHHQVSNQTHGIGTPLVNGAPEFPATVYDVSPAFGSAGELEEVHFLNNISLLPTNPDGLINPSIEPYKPTSNVVNAGFAFGWPTTLDGQTMSQIRIVGSIPPDNGEISRFFSREGQFSMWLASAMSMMIHEIAHRYGAYVRFVHPTKGNGFDSYDLLGLDTQHWSYFFNTAVPDSQFAGAPRSSANMGNHIVDLGPLAAYEGVPTNLQAGESLFVIPSDQLVDGFSALDQYLMGIRRADEVGSFWYVDEPRSIYTGQSLDVFDPSNPLNTSATMRAWFPQAGIAFAGKRVELTVQNIMDFEKIREGNENPKGRRFWGPKGNLKVRYFSDTGRVDPNGDASVTLSEEDRALGDEADRIDANGKPVDVKTMAFILVVKSGDPSAHASAISQVDAFRQAWQAYGNGPATGGRGKFDTRLNPPIH